jgi:prevent-host-death family protein
MKQATISFTKNNLSKLLELVKRGETVTILDRTKPVARLTPVPNTGKSALDRRLDDLERRGLIRRGSGKMPDWILTQPPLRTASGFSLSEAIIREREEGR